MGFKNFWSHYPIKVAKVDAEKAWKHLAPPLSLEELMLQRLDKQIEHRHSLMVRGIWVPDWPRAAKWIRGARWDDELEPVLRMTLATPQQVRDQARLDQTRAVFDAMAGGLTRQEAIRKVFGS